MDRRYSVTHLILASVIVLGLTPLGGINKDSPIIPMGTGIPHGHPTVNALPSILIGRGTLKTMKST